MPLTPANQAVDTQASADRLSDAEQMRRLGQGDLAALGQLVRRHQQRVRAIAYRMTHRWDMADDIAQEVFLRVHRSAVRYRPTAAFSTFLYRIVTNLCLDRAKSPRLLSLAGQEVPQRAAADGPLLEQEKARAVQRAIASLPERQRLAVVMHRFEHLGHEQIAQITGWSVPAIETLLTRAYAQLRKDLAQWKDE